MSGRAQKTIAAAGPLKLLMAVDMNVYYIKSEGFDPWRNLALEEHLMERYGDGALLYLWQNQNTVVIGRNQNPWRECRLELLEREGGRLARRPSGGGAVFHDLGNLCFSFIMRADIYDLQRQLSVIISACKALGVNADFSGRNDITVDGCKFSGNAFRNTRSTSLQHGTLLVDVDMDKLARYLAPPPDKIESKGIKSVRSRVVNLADIAPVTVPAMQRQLLREFEREYGPAIELDESAVDLSRVAELYKKYSSSEWRLGQTFPFDVEISSRFGWGGVTLLLKLENNKVASATVYSDAMDETLPAALEQALVGADYGRAMGDVLTQKMGGDERAHSLGLFLKHRDY